MEIAQEVNKDTCMKRTPFHSLLLKLTFNHMSITYKENREM